MLAAQTHAISLGEGLATLLWFAGQSQESSCMIVQQLAVYGKIEQKAGMKTCCSQPASLLLCLETA